jgi:hypothetical protein
MQPVFAKSVTYAMWGQPSAAPTFILVFGELGNFLAPQNPQIHSVSICKLLCYLVFATINRRYNGIASAYKLIRQIELSTVFRNSKTDIFVRLRYGVEFNG